MSYDINPIARALAASAILGTLVLGAPAQAATGQPTATQTVPVQKASPTKTSPTERVETRIAALHAGLAITPAQEKQWNGVAQAMRDSAAAIEAIAGDRHKKIKTMTAVDDLRSYQSLSQAHAEGMKKVVDAFAPLYDGMSDSQKKAADMLFRHHERHRAAAKKA